MQIQDYQEDLNPYNHTSRDTIAHMNLDYWVSQVKATTAMIAHLAIPTGYAPKPIHLPMVAKAH